MDEDFVEFRIYVKALTIIVYENRCFATGALFEILEQKYAVTYSLVLSQRSWDS